MKTVFWTPERMAKMKAYAREGLTSSEVAGLLGKTQTAIRKQAAKRGITFAGQPVPWTDEEDAIVRRMLGEGFGQKDIARELPGRTPNAVIGHARRNNIKFLRGEKPKKYRYSRPKEKPAPPVQRKCLGGCGRYFESSWIGNRICKSCGSSSAYSSGAMA